MNASAARASLAVLLFLTQVTLSACDEGGVPIGAPIDTASAAQDDAPGTGDGSVTCGYFYRPSNELMDGQSGQEPAFQFDERVLDVSADEDSSETLGRLTFSVGYHTAETDVDSVHVRVATDTVSVLSILYQLGSGLPLNQFAGGHGFTGLLYFTHPTEGGDYQAFCEAVR